MWCIGYANDYRSHLRKYPPLCSLHVLSPASHVAFMRMGVSKSSKTLIARQRRGFNPDSSVLHGRAAAEGFPQLPCAHPKRTIESSKENERIENISSLQGTALKISSIEGSFLWVHLLWLRSCIFKYSTYILHIFNARHCILDVFKFLPSFSILMSMVLFGWARGSCELAARPEFLAWRLMILLLI